jgi:hypothetical protein
VDWLHVRQGRWLVRDWYIPITAVREVNGDGVFLKVKREDLRRLRWQRPPIEFLARQGATPGYEYATRREPPEYGEAAPPA